MNLYTLYTFDFEAFIEKYKLHREFPNKTTEQIIQSIFLAFTNAEEAFQFCNTNGIFTVAIPELEPIILTSTYYTYLYTIRFKTERWPEAEKVLCKDPIYWQEYKSRFIN